MRNRPSSWTYIPLLVSILLLGAGCSRDTSVEPTVEEVAVAAPDKAAPVVGDPWAGAQSSQITSGPDYDVLSRRAMGVDAQGNVHAIYQRGIGAELGLYYVTCASGGEWSEPVTLGAAGTYPGTGWLEVRAETGEIYVVFHEGHGLKLGVRSGGAWTFHALETPAGLGVAKPAMTIDANGNAHIALLANYDDPSGFVNWRIGYGYWDGSADFHFQLLEHSWVPHHGLFAQPDIVAWPDGRVALAYHHNDNGMFVIRVDENAALGGAEWTGQHVDLRDCMPYPESLEMGPDGSLHLAFHTNIELGAEHKVRYAVRKDTRFGRPMDVGGDFPGARPRLAVSNDGAAHLVFEEMSGPSATGRLVHAYRYRGKWVQEVISDNAAFTPSFVLNDDDQGNLLYEKRIVQIEDNDIMYFGSTGF